MSWLSQPSNWTYDPLHEFEDESVMIFRCRKMVGLGLEKKKRRCTALRMSQPAYAYKRKKEKHD
jgi:hypothetical protein